jgi:beta-mannanase
VSVLAAILTGTGAALTAGLPAQAGTGAELKLSATDDTYTSSSRRTATFGTEDKLAAGRRNGNSRISYLKFTVPAGTGVTGARLKLTAIGGAAGTISVSRIVDNSWTETKLTSATAPVLGLVVASVTPAPSAADLTFDLGAEIAGPGTYSFAVRSSSPDKVTRFRSAEATSGRPELTVTTAAVVPPVSTPAPAPTTGTSAPAPTTGTSAPAPTTSTPAPAGNCVTGALLVPSCGVLWGAAAGGFTSAPRDAELKNWEKLSGRTATIFHTYHKGDERFPTKAEIAMTADAAHPRVLLLNWKISYGSDWAKVAAGEQDKRIDAFAVRVKAYGKQFFLALNHEPEDDVIARAGSGWQAKDFAAMYRHTILRLRAQGVTNAINVVAYMGNEKWMSQSWWKDLYPGDDVVDWMGLDSYVSAETGYYHYGMFAALLDRKGTTGPGFYDWAVSQHPSKPMMVAEWGVYHRVGKITDKAPAFRSVLPELAQRPQIKAVVYFDTSHDNTGDRDISITSSRTGLAAFKTLAANPLFNVQIG